MANAENHLIESLPRKDRARLLGACEPVELVLSEVLFDRGATTRWVYFPVDGFISLLTQVDQHAGLEVGMVGREGMLGMQLVLGVAQEPWQSLVQGPGSAWRLDADAFRRQLEESAALQNCMKRYVYVLMAQMATATACLRFHSIGPRLARWLLMSQDRAHSDHFYMTHEFLAAMLGVRRVGVTMAAGALQRSGLIAYRRGELTVLDRCGLEGAACSCYAADVRVHLAWLPPAKPDKPRLPVVSPPLHSSFPAAM